MLCTLPFVAATLTATLAAAATPDSLAATPDSLAAAGWELPEPELLAILHRSGLPSDGCDELRRVDASTLSSAALLGRDRQPTLLPGLQRGWSAFGAPGWDGREFLARHGGENATVRWPLGQRQVGIFARQTTVSSYVATMRRASSGLLFGRSAIGVAGGEWAVPPAFAAANMSSTVISVAPSGRGLPFHTHAPALLSVVRGSKLVLLLPPGARAADPAASLHVAPVRELLDRGRLRSTLRQQGIDPSLLRSCLLRAGDSIFLPCDWQHATMSVGDSLAVGAQVSSDGGEQQQQHSCSPTPGSAAHSQLRGVLRTGAATPEPELRRLEETLAAALAELPFNFGFALWLARLRGRRGQHELAVAAALKAAKEYRKLDGMAASLALSTLAAHFAGAAANVAGSTASQYRKAAAELVDEAIRRDGEGLNPEARVLRARLTGGAEASRSALSMLETLAELGPAAAPWYRYGSPPTATLLDRLTVEMRAGAAGRQEL